MLDPRITSIANIIVNYSTRIQAGELVAIMGPQAARPLLVELYRHALQAGAHPEIFCRLPEANEILLREGDKDQIRHISPALELVIDRYDCRIAVVADENTRSLTSVDPSNQVVRAQGLRQLAARDLARMADPKDPYRWVGTLFPTDAYAQDAEMSLSEYAAFVFGACLPTLDQLPEDARAFASPGADPDDPLAFWEAFSRWQGQLVSYLADKRELHVVGPNIDLRLGVAGRTWLNADGHVNFPDGEVFTGPIEDAVEGWVRFTYPAIYGGKEVRDVQLRFQAGQVIEASASRGEDYLLKMLDTDEGARRLGEFAIGTNPNITRFTGHTLFDEKIKGTCHMAIGKSIPGTGGVNESAVHWDMVCDLRQDSRIYADDELLYENGDFVVCFADRAGSDRANGLGFGSMGNLQSRR